MKPQIVYDEGVSDREDFLDKAEEVATLTMPWIKPKGEDIEENPWTSQGTSSVRNLSSSTMKLMLPAGVEWARIDFPQFVWTTLNEKAADPEEPKVTPEGVTALRDTLTQRTGETHESLRQKNIRSRMSMGLTRNLIEGTTVGHNTEAGVRIFPLRSAVVRRDEFGKVEYVVLKQVRDPFPEEMQDTGDRTNKQQISYTLVDFAKDEVWFQHPAKDGEEPVVELTKEPADRYFVMVGELPDVDDYPVGYFYNFIRLIASINHAEASLADAMSLASWNPLGIREGSALADDTDQITKRKTGEPVVMQENDAFPAVTNQQKLGEWGFIGGILEHDKAELASISAKGIKDRAMSPATSATAVIQMIDELNSQTQDLLSALEETFQRPLFQSEMSILEARTPMFDDETTALLGGHVKVTVVTGINALEKQRTFTQFITGAIPLAMQLDPSVGVDGIAILDRMAETMLMDVEGIYFRIQQQTPPTGTEPGTNGQTDKRNAFTAGGPQGPETQPAAAQNQ